MHQNSVRKSQIRLHIVVFIWGFTAILGNLISKEAIALVWNRMGIAIIVLFIYLWIRKINFKVNLKSLGIFALAGTLIAAHWIAFFHAVKISNVSITLVCMSSGAFFTALLEPLFYKRKPYFFELLLGLIVISAIGLIFTVQLAYLWGILTALLASFLAALFSVINGKIVHRYDSEVITFYELSTGWVAISILLLAQGNMSWLLLPQNQLDWIYLLILGVICTAYPFIESVRVMRQLSPFTVVLTINMEPVYGIILAFFIFGEAERMTPTFYLGALLIIAALFANAFLRKRFNTSAL